MCCERILDTRCYKTVWAERNDAYKIMSMAVIGILIWLLVKGTAEESKARETLVVYLGLLGNMWIKTLKMIVLPFMLTNMSTSVAETKMLKNTGGLAKITFMWYIATTCAACVMGITMGSLFLLPTIEKHDSVNNTSTGSLKADPVLAPATIIDSLIPGNFTMALAKDEFVAVIVCSIFLGALMNVPRDNEEQEKVPDPHLNNSHCLYLALKEVNDICFYCIKTLVDYTPIALLSLMIKITATMDLSKAAGEIVLVYAATYVGMLLHLAGTLPGLYFIFTRRNAYPKMKNVGKAALIAVTTASSACTLPATITCAIENNKVRPSIAKFVCSLGATVNMDGTAIYYPIASMFIILSQGHKLFFGEILMMGIMAALTSMGASPIPGAGAVVFLQAICATVGVTGVDESPAFLLCLALDWLGDRPATMCNIMGDSVGCVVVDAYAKKNGISDDMDDSRLSQSADEHVRRFSHINEAALLANNTPSHVTSNKA